MINICATCQRILADAGIRTRHIERAETDALIFEGPTVLGFVFAYDSAQALLARWEVDSRALISEHQFALRQAQSKAWNTYTIFLAGDYSSYPERVALSAIEENLVGTRKIARAAINDADAVRNALLPLLPIQSAPHLDLVDMKAEIRLRTTELPDLVVEAFLSNANEGVVSQMLEDIP